MTKPPTPDIPGDPGTDTKRRPDLSSEWTSHSVERWGNEIDNKIPEMKMSVYAALGRMDSETFEAITDNILTIIHERKKKGLENGPHVAQVEAYTRLILENIDEEEFSLKHDFPQDQTAEAFGDPIPDEETLLEGKRRLTILCALVHDIHKKIEPGFLVTHAFQSAREIASGELFRSLFEKYISEQEIGTLSLLTARIIETHSSIPFINENLLNQDVHGSLYEIKRKEDAPPLMFKQERERHGIIDIQMFEPEDIIGRILRIADGLSNYGVFPNLEIDLLEGKTEIQMKYAGFIKIAGLTSNATISERIDEIIKSSRNYIAQEMYEGVTFAKSVAEISITAMECLQLYFTDGDGKATDHLGVYTSEPDDTEAKETWRIGLSEELEKALAAMESKILDLLPSSKV